MFCIGLAIGVGALTGPSSDVLASSEGRNAVG